MKFIVNLRIIILIIFIFLLNISLVNAQNQNDVISEIVIEGNQRVEIDTINSYINLSKGDEFNSDILNKTLKSLFSTGFFSDVKIVKNESVLIIKVIENPIVNRIIFEGNDEIEDDVLEAEISMKSRNLFTRSKIQNDVERILNLYRAEGSFSSKVTPKIISLPQNRVDIVFEIYEGENTIINSITFNGNKNFSDRRLRDIIITRQTRWYSILSSSDRYDPQQLVVDESLIRQFYKNHGYADVEIKSAVAQLDRNQEGFNIIFGINEGMKYNYDQIKIVTNNNEINTDIIIKELTIEEGDVYSAGKIEKSVKVITDLVNDQGFPFTETIPEVERIDDTNKIAVVFNINEAEKKYIGKISIIGNDRTLDSIIRRNIRLAEGDAFVPGLIARSKTLIGNLGFFSKVDIKEVSSVKEGYSDLIVEVAETSTGEVSFGGGYSSQVGGLVNIGITEKNFLGKGQRLSTNAKLSERRSEYSISFAEPYLFNRDLYSSANLYNNTMDYRESRYDLKREGFDLTGNFSLSEYSRQSLGYSLEVRTLKSRSGASATIVAEEGETTLSEISTSISFDKTNSKMIPTAGYNISVAAALAGVGGDKKFIRINNIGNYYKSFNDDLITLGIDYRTGIIMGLGQDILISDRYFLGGNNFRGFEQSGIGPRDVSSRDSLGGNIYYTGTLKATFGIGLPPELGVKGNWFTTFGSLTGIDKSSVTYYDNGAIRLSTGLGVSWESPFGPISIIFSEAILKEDYDVTESLSFGIGSKF
jgi:outer membrane protein insertion porin family